MIEVRTVEDVYPALEELIVELRTTGGPRLAAILNHRMHQVAWTTRSELLHELKTVLRKSLQSDDTILSQPVRSQVERILSVISDSLENEH